MKIHRYDRVRTHRNDRVNDPRNDIWITPEESAETSGVIVKLVTFDMILQVTPDVFQNSSGVRP